MASAVLPYNSNAYNGGNHHPHQHHHQTNHHHQGNGLPLATPTINHQQQNGGNSIPNIPLPIVPVGGGYYNDGMELVWHGEFSRLFGQFFPPHVWYLAITSQAPTQKWKFHRDSAKVRFCCQECGNGWTSMKGRVTFWFNLNYATNEGSVQFKLYGQQCKKCNSGKFEYVMWYPEEVSKVMCNVYHKVGQTYYGFMQPPIRIDRRPGRPRNQHNSDLCQACRDGECDQGRPVKSLFNMNGIMHAPVTVPAAPILTNGASNDTTPNNYNHTIHSNGVSMPPPHTSNDVTMRNMRGGVTTSVSTNGLVTYSTHPPAPQIKTAPQCLPPVPPNIPPPPPLSFPLYPPPYFFPQLTVPMIGGGGPRTAYLPHAQQQQHVQQQQRQMNHNTRNKPSSKAVVITSVAEHNEKNKKDQVSVTKAAIKLANGVMDKVTEKLDKLNLEAAAAVAAKAANNNRKEIIPTKQSNQITNGEHPKGEEQVKENGDK